ncbi:MAG: sulfatase-like hydrolase/transferase [Candidatus Accumulibacter sp. UW25]
MTARPALSPPPPLSGKQLPAPAPEPAFGGVIKDDALQSKPWWPPRIVPPKGAPNVLLIMTDDAGFAVPSTFRRRHPDADHGPHRGNGLRYNRMFSTALCSPTRAALITGRNHHSVGFGVISEQATGFPGYNSVIGVDNATIGRILRDNGYDTSWFGKDHNTPTYQASQVRPVHPVADRHGLRLLLRLRRRRRQPVGPNLFRNTTQIYPWIHGHPEDGSIGSRLAGHRQGALMEPDHCDGRRRHRLDDADAPDRSRAADLHQVRARRHARAASPDPGMGGQDPVPCTSSTTVTRRCASASSRTRRSSA